MSNKIDSNKLTLYHFSTCPYCRRVRDEIANLGLKIKSKDTHEDIDALIELRQGGGKTQVPCLRIEHSKDKIEWLYESTDIIDFLSEI